MKNLKFLGLLSLLLLMTFGCAKEGCTNLDASNYNSEAKKDDGSCTYEGSIVFWYGESTATNLVADGSTSLTYTFDGAIVGSTAANVYDVTVPDCGADGSITVVKNLGLSNSKSFNYTITDQDDFVRWTGSAILDANTCLKLELDF